MGDLVLKGSTSGQITVTPTAVAGTNTLTLPAATGNIITSADSGTVTQTMLSTNVAGNGPAFSAYRALASGNQSVSNSTQTAAALDTKLFDTASCFNNTGSTVTLNGLSVPAYSFCPNVAGYYQVNGRLDPYASSGLNFGQANIFKNGSIYKSGALINASVSEMAIAVSGIVYLNGTGDYTTFYGFVTGSAGQVFLASEYNLWFDGALLRSA